MASAGNQSQKDKMMAARLKALGDERTSGICAVCYRQIRIFGPKSRYTHVCKGGK